MFKMFKMFKIQPTCPCSRANRRHSIMLTPPGWARQRLARKPGAVPMDDAEGPPYCPTMLAETVSAEMHRHTVEVGRRLCGFSQPSWLRQCLSLRTAGAGRGP